MRGSCSDRTVETIRAAVEKPPPSQMLRRTSQPQERREMEERKVVNSSAALRACARECRPSLTPPHLSKNCPTSASRKMLRYDMQDKRDGQDA